MVEYLLPEAEWWVQTLEGKDGVSSGSPLRHGWHWGAFLYLSQRLKFFFHKMGVKCLLPKAFQDLNITLYIKLKAC